MPFCATEFVLDFTAFGYSFLTLVVHKVVTGSITTCLMRGGIFNDRFTANFL